MSDFSDYAEQCVLCVKSRIMMAFLAVWAIFSFGVQAYVRTLNKIIVPILEMPLGLFLAVQGAVIMFAVLLFWFARQRPVPVSVAPVAARGQYQ
jgi:putative solute:sodium symporter small subunit